MFCSCLSFSFGCCCLSPYILLHSHLRCGKRSLREQCVCIEVCLCACACVHMFAKLKLERQSSREVWRVRYSWRRLCIFTRISQTEAPLSPWLFPTCFFTHIVKTRLICGETGALALAATRMCLCQILPLLSRLSQALSGFQMATGFQDWHH